MEQPKKLNIIAITDYSPYGDAAVRYGSVLAAIFKASLTIVTDFTFYPKSLDEMKRSPQDKQTKTDIWKEEIGQIRSAVNDPDFQISSNFDRTLDNLAEHEIETFLLTEHFIPKTLHDHAEKTNTVMFVIGVSKDGKGNFFSRKKAAKFIKPSRLPVMTVGDKMPESNIFKHVILPLDIDRQAKEKVLWAGYFSRFYCAVVHVLYSTYKDEFLQRKVKDNVAFTEKLYHNLEIEYKLHEIHPTADNMDRYSLAFAKEIDASLTVIMMTRYYSLIDRLAGPKEFAIIGNEQGFPVLCINERDDLYVLCT